MIDMQHDIGHLNGLCRSLGIRPECREMATAKEMGFARGWMRLRGNAYREQVEHERAEREKARRGSTDNE